MTLKFFRVWRPLADPDHGAMNDVTSTPHIAAAAAVALNFEGAAAPEWVELIPPGHDVVGRDGRRWINPDPAAVVAATPVTVHPLPLDWEHSTEHRAPQGLDAPAAAWIEELEVRDGGAIWGRPAWTARGAAQVAAREYRFLSPVFAYDKASGRITRLLSAGLTNTPNLSLTALNREGRQREPSEDTLDLALLREALSLPADASDDAILAAARQGTAANSAKKDTPASVDLSSYAPRADLTAALNRATTAETELKALKDANRATEIEKAINSAMDAGKIVPASAETYRAMCREEGGLERFNELVKTLPVIAGAAETRAANRVEKTDGKSSLTEEERAVCRQLGQSEEDFIAAKQQKEG